MLDRVREVNIYYVPRVKFRSDEGIFFYTVDIHLNHLP